MKHIRVALLLCALPATALAQSVVCQTCDHVAPFFRGTGGFIATVAEGVDEVVFVVSCGNVTVTGEAEPQGGKVAQLFNHRNGLACDLEGGFLEISGLEDGGWYWITDARNSAVGSLVRADILDNETTPLTGAGAGVTMEEGRGAVFLKELSSGRVGILPSILPEPSAPDAVLCGPRYNALADAFSDQQAGSCMLGDGGTKIRLTGPAAHGRRETITSGMVTRPATGDLVVNADLWVNETGSVSTADPATPALGWEGKDEAGTNWLNAVFTVGLEDAPPGVADVDALAGANVVLTNSGDSAVGTNPAGQAVITISASAEYCPASGEQRTATLSIRAAHTVGGNRNPNNLVPQPSALAGSGSLSAFAAATRLSVICPPAR